MEPPEVERRSAVWTDVAQGDGVAGFGSLKNHRFIEQGPPQGHPCDFFRERRNIPTLLYVHRISSCFLSGCLPHGGVRLALDREAGPRLGKLNRQPLRGKSFRNLCADGEGSIHCRTLLHFRIVAR